MFEPVDYSANAFYKLSESSLDCPSRFYGFTYGTVTLFIKRIRAKRFAVCGLGGGFVPLRMQRDTNIYSEHDSLESAIVNFNRLVRLVLK